MSNHTPGSLLGAENTAELEMHSLASWSSSILSHLKQPQLSFKVQLTCHLLWETFGDTPSFTYMSDASYARVYNIFKNPSKNTGIASGGT